tara:strand:- start:626 stop:1423 length:798 start_codon:yes stop_codon:yes gene_type:complete
MRLIMSGAAGRMGQCIIGLIQRAEDCELAGAVEISGHPAVGLDAGTFAGYGVVGVEVSDVLEKVVDQADAVIDFSLPSGTMENAKICAKHSTPLVIGTTGISSIQADALQQLVRTFPCVLAPNMSIGINVLLNVLADMAVVLQKDYDVEVVEAHHRFKQDAPSGTALGMAKEIARAQGKDFDMMGIYGRQGERKPGEIGMQSIRAGDIVGDHTVYFGGVGERIEITHRAQSREPFAYGAIQAARWVSAQPPGLYDMQDVLGLKKD